MDAFVQDRVAIVVNIDIDQVEDEEINKKY
jgi:hypothetical protein